MAVRKRKTYKKRNLERGQGDPESYAQFESARMGKRDDVLVAKKACQEKSVTPNALVVT